MSVIDYVSDGRPSTAVELGLRIREKTTTLATYPNLYRAGRIRGIRKMNSIPSYIVVYRVAGEQVQILRVRHARHHRS